MTDGSNGTATFISLGEAARRTGLPKTTLARKIRAGELSVCEKGDDGAYRIDPAELIRFMAVSRVVRAASADGAVGPPAETAETPLVARVAIAEARATMFEGQLAELKAMTEVQLAEVKSALAAAQADRDRWHEQATAMTRLLPAPTSQPEQPRGWRWWRRREG